MSPDALPIRTIRLQVLEHLQQGNRLVLVAPTGSGKTTQVPQYLLDAGLGGGGKVVVLQPRRVAARTVAARVASERRASLGVEVGYQVRFDDQTSLGTRLSYITEGILLRSLQENPSLEGIGAVIFDEFHERNLLSDVALGIVKRVQENQRPELKLAVMSATLEAEPVAAYLGGAPILQCEGTLFPIETRYLDQHDERPITEQAAGLVESIVRSGEPGDILVFMPGAGEIHGTIGAIHSARLNERVMLIPLHGELPPEEQDRAFAPCPVRKVVVATNVAETSVTIEGIRHVVDSGLARISRYDPERGIGTLHIEPISRASADQRRGRAGRTGPGICHRLWTESGHLNRPERNTPEIQRSDLAEVVLLLHSLGIKHAVTFDWLDKPDPQAVERAETLLSILGALGPSGASVEAPTSETSDLTPVGRQMLRLPMHPRYSRMLVEASRRGCVPAAALCAALVSGRDMLLRLGRDDQHIRDARELFEASQASDFYTLMRAYEFARKNQFAGESCRRYGINASIARQVAQTYEQLMELARRQRMLAPENDPAERRESPPEALPRSIMCGFIDQLCVRRDQGTLDCDLPEGRTGTLMRESVVQNARMFVASNIREVSGRGSGPLTLLGLATEVRLEWIQESFPHLMSSRLEHLYDRTHRRVAAVKLVRLLDLVVHHEHQREADPEASGACLADACLKEWFELPLLNHEVKQFMARVNLIAAAMPELELPAFDHAAIRTVLSRAFRGLTLAKEAQATPLRDAFHHYLGDSRLGWVEELAPKTVKWPNGRDLKLLYVEQPVRAAGVPEGPELQLKLHECFVLQEHPRICEGRVPVRLWLCNPEGKRLDSTRDWPAFRTQQYPKLRSGLLQKFPGVTWP